MRKKNELYTGAKVGRWTLLERVATGKGHRWRCECECGTKRDVLESSLLYGYSFSCSCAKDTHTRTEQKDLAGQRFGDLEALNAVYMADKRFSVRWRCRCICGNEIEVGQKLLISGVVQNCGCKTEVRYSDITGRRFGRLMAVRPLDQADERRSKIWHCVSDCGNELDVPYNTLLYGNTRSCGCKKRESDQKLAARVSRVAGTSIDHLKSKKIPTNNTTGVKGVYKDKRGRFVVSIGFQKKHYFLGYYKTLEEAAAVRREAEETLNDQVSDFYVRWKQRADADPDWAEMNPIQIEVEKQGSNIQVMLLPKM